jgi:A/G-specific adenine glycosylase
MPDIAGSHETDSETVTVPVTRLLSWYRESRRALPWRETTDPYRIWLSEVMLQQTQVATVVPYYERFLARFPDISCLARASEQEVLKVWENLGYYSRARQLHRASVFIMDQYGGQIPKCYEDLIRLPGVGSYTAGAILSIAFGQAVPAIDGNVRRVLCRFFVLSEIYADKDGYGRLSDILTPLLPPGQTGDFNQALMELGATICRSRQPLCSECPLYKECLARKHSQPEAFPTPSKKKIIPVRDAVAAMIHDGRGRVLVVQRPSLGLLGSLWKFPGGFKEPEEALAQALKRTVSEETGLGIVEEMFVKTIKHAYTHFRLRLHVFSCPAVDGEVQKGGCADYRWIDPDEFKELPFSKADRLAGEHYQNQNRHSVMLKGAFSTTTVS